MYTVTIDLCTGITAGNCRWSRDDGVVAIGYKHCIHLKLIMADIAVIKVTDIGVQNVIVNIVTTGVSCVVAGTAVVKSQVVICTAQISTNCAQQQLRFRVI